MEFLQVTLSKNFYYEDDFVIEQLQASMTELRKAKLELPPPGTAGARHTKYSLQDVVTPSFQVKGCFNLLLGKT